MLYGLSRGHECHYCIYSTYLVHSYVLWLSFRQTKLLYYSVWLSHTTQIYTARSCSAFDSPTQNTDIVFCSVLRPRCLLYIHTWCKFFPMCSWLFCRDWFSGVCADCLSICHSTSSWLLWHPGTSATAHWQQVKEWLSVYVSALLYEVLHERHVAYNLPALPLLPSIASIT